MGRLTGRRVVTAATYASGVAAALGAVGVGVLAGQVAMARLTIPGAQSPPPRCSGDYGLEYAGAQVLRLAVLGDSTAAGYGARTRSETPGYLLATAIAAAAHRPVRLACPAVVGSISAWLPAQLEALLAAHPDDPAARRPGVDLAIIFIGANDVTGRVDEAIAVRHLADTIYALRALGAEAVVATCPDLGAIQPIQPPLRWLARRWSRRLAAAQTVAVVRAGGRTVSLADLLSPMFEAAPDRMFGDDRYHPSAEGYQAAVAVVLPAALDALGLSRPSHGTAPTTPRGLAVAARAAVRTPGAQIRPHSRRANGRKSHAAAEHPDQAPNPGADGDSGGRIDTVPTSSGPASTGPSTLRPGGAADAVTSDPDRRPATARPAEEVRP